MTAKQKLTAQAYHIRWMIRRDMPEVLEIEQACFANCWEEEDFIRVLRLRNAIGMVAEHCDRVMGFMIYELNKQRLNILNFAVHPDYHRMKAGTRMIDKLKGKLSEHRRNRILLEVREKNLPMQLFLRSQGFKAISVLRDFYEDTTEDAYLMEWKLPAGL